MAPKKIGILLMACCAAAYCPSAFAQGSGTGGSSAGSSAAATAGAGTGAHPGSTNSGLSAPSGTGTLDVTTGANRITNSRPGDPNVQVPTPNKPPAAAQAERNVGAGHAPNGQPIGTPGTGTSEEDQMRQ